jgi:uncharacterized RDD family membrane protein YckC
MHQLKAQYEKQDNDSLLEIAEKELTPEARNVLKEVLVTRGISAKKVDDAEALGIDKRVKDKEKGKRLATRFSRLIAFVIDLVLGIAIFGVLFWPFSYFSDQLHKSLMVIGWLGYFLFRDAIPGQSFGKRALGIRVVKEVSGKSCTWWDSFIRNIAHNLFFLDAFFIFGSSQKRIGDIATGTIVVRNKF